jgi:hypothetical protein
MVSTILYILISFQEVHLSAIAKPASRFRIWPKYETNPSNFLYIIETKEYGLLQRWPETEPSGGGT